MKNLTTAFFALSLPAAAAILPMHEPSPNIASVAGGAFTHAGGMEIDGGGDIDITDLRVFSLLSAPIPLGGTWSLTPDLQYRFTQFNVAKLPAAVPLEDESLHSLALGAYLLSRSDSSSWIYGGWARVRLSGDYDHISTDSLTLDLALGAGYKVSPQLMLGVAVAAVNIGRDEWIIPGPLLDWRPHDDFRVLAMGPNVSATWQPDACWQVSLRGEPGGGLWNIRDAADRSRILDLDSYRVGVFVDRKIAGDWWVSLGGGVTLANEVALTTPSGRTIYKEDVDEGWFAQFSVNLKVW